MDVRVGLERKLSAEELMLLNCGVGEDSLFLQSIRHLLVLKKSKCWHCPENLTDL